MIPPSNQFTEVVVIFGAGFVDVFEINTHPPRAIDLFHQDRVGYPSLVFDFSENVGLNQLINL